MSQTKLPLLTTVTGGRNITDVHLSPEFLGGTPPPRPTRKTSGLGTKVVSVALPLWKKVVFVDWHGVLSSHSFWWSILGSARHPYRRIVGGKVATLFSDGARVEAWMRGHFASPLLVSQLDTRLPGRAKDDYLLRTLYQDCRTMPLNQELLARLRQVRQSSFVVIATDNMDCFFHEAVNRSDLDRHFDDMLCSSVLGVLKADNAISFFGDWLDAHELNFKDALLIDDAEKNCVEFERKGGTALLYKSIEDLWMLDSWMKD